MPEVRTNGRPVDLLFDARHVRQSGVGTYIRTQPSAPNFLTWRRLRPVTVSLGRSWETATYSLSCARALVSSSSPVR
jgi:hypothetical protein